MKILLVVPPFVEEGLEMAAKESIGVCYLTGVLRQHGFEADILEADLLELTVEQTIKEICRCQYALIGFSVLEGTIESTADILEGVRRRDGDIHIVLGGFFPTLIAEEILLNMPAVSSVIIGEGEYTLLELAQCIKTGEDWRNIRGIAYRQQNQSTVSSQQSAVSSRQLPVASQQSAVSSQQSTVSGHRVIVNETREPFDLDAVPFPARDLLPEVLRRGGVVGIVGSRGCFAHCSFCCIGRFNEVSKFPAWRGRTPVNIVDEIEQLVREWDVKTISFYDSIFIGPGKAGVQRAYNIAEEILRRGLRIHFAISARPDQVEKDLFAFLKTAGLIEVFIGIEAMSQPILDLYEKRVSVEENLKAVGVLEELEIFFRPGFIMYEPYITLEQIKENMQHLRKLNNSPYCNKYHFFKALRVYRGSPLEDRFRHEGVLIRNGWHNAYRCREPSVEKFIRFAGVVGSKMLPLLDQINGVEPEARRYLDNLLGKWSLDAYEEILDTLQTGDAPQEKYIDIIASAEEKLNKIQQIADRYVNYEQHLERNLDVPHTSRLCHTCAA